MMKLFHTYIHHPADGGKGKEWGLTASIATKERMLITRGQFSDFKFPILEVRKKLQLQVECWKCNEYTEGHEMIPAGCTGVSFMKELSFKFGLEE